MPKTWNNNRPITILFTWGLEASSKQAPSEYNQSKKGEKAAMSTARRRRKNLLLTLTGSQFSPKIQLTGSSRAATRRAISSKITATPSLRDSAKVEEGHLLDLHKGRLQSVAHHPVTLEDQQTL
jgi:hypothetical protein